MIHEIAPLDFITCVQGVEGEGEGRKRERGRGEGEREKGRGRRGRGMGGGGEKNESWVYLALRQTRQLQHAFDRVCFWQKYD